MCRVRETSTSLEATRGMASPIAQEGADSVGGDSAILEALTYLTTMNISLLIPIGDLRIQLTVI